MLPSLTLQGAVCVGQAPGSRQHSEQMEFQAKPSGLGYWNTICCWICGQANGPCVWLILLLLLLLLA